MSKFTFERANSWVEAARRIKENPGLQVHAGGIDNIDLIKEGILPIDGLVSLAKLRSKKPIRKNKKMDIILNSMVSLSEISNHPLIQEKATALAQAAGKAATPNIRNVATLGGNLCQQPRCEYFRNKLLPCLRRGAEQCPAIEGDHENLAVFENTFCAAVLPSSLAISLAALGAEIDIVTGEKQRRMIPVEQLYRSGLESTQTHLMLDSGELIERIVIPHKGGIRSQYLKVKPRESFDWPIVEAAAAVSLTEDGRVNHIRVVLGGVAMLPWRATLSEVELQGNILNADSCRKAAKKAAHGATPLRDNHYKTRIIEGTVERVLTALIPQE